jgi:hypothetical protein
MVPFGNLNVVRRGSITVEASADTHEKLPAREITIILTYYPSRVKRQ